MRFFPGRTEPFLSRARASWSRCVVVVWCASCGSKGGSGLPGGDDGSNPGGSDGGSGTTCMTFGCSTNANGDDGGFTTQTSRGRRRCRDGCPEEWPRQRQQLPWVSQRGERDGAQGGQRELGFAQVALPVRPHRLPGRHPVATHAAVEPERDARRRLSASALAEVRLHGLLQGIEPSSESEDPR